MALGETVMRRDALYGLLLVIYIQKAVNSTYIIIYGVIKDNGGLLLV